MDEGRAIQRLGGREQYANIEDPKTARNILNHLNHLCHKPFTLSDIR